MIFQMTTDINGELLDVRDSRHAALMYIEIGPITYKVFRPTTTHLYAWALVSGHNKWGHSHHGAAESLDDIFTQIEDHLLQSQEQKDQDARRPA
jgi:hypothetical protein